MKLTFSKKLKLFKKIIRQVDNWYVIPLIYYGLLKKEFVILNLKNDQKLKLRVNSTDFYAFVNVCIIEEYKKEGFEIGENSTVIDVGGHIGIFSVYASQFCKNGRILTFEPITDNFKVLEENLSLNEFTNIKVFNVAVAGRQSKVKIFHNEDQAAHTIYGEGDKHTEINAISLREILDSNGVQKCDLLKLDCEGAEYEILAFLPDEYFERISRICMEYHPIENWNKHLTELISRLKKLNYKVTTFPYSDGLGLLFANEQ